MKSRLLIIGALVAMAFCSLASANTYTIDYAGATASTKLVVTGVTPGSQVNISIPGTVVGDVQLNNNSAYADSAEGAAISAVAFDYTSSGTFIPNPLTGFTIGSPSGSGQLTASINFITLSSTGPGGFVLNIFLSNATYTCTGCTFSPALSAFAAGGTGILSFQFTALSGGPQSVADLLNLGYGQSFNTSYSASLTNVPEPGSLALFGSGLIAAAGAIRRKLGR
ncbi:MAG TPA: PEP-CTERM sorting domain-containing protein [Terriglobales bacterium]|nr:PEP-CTERM sorting domain-containing protein [Terriglobales bacterium]